MEKPVLCIIGLGYVGLPLTYIFARAGYTVHGFDIQEERIAELKDNKDRTNELTTEQLQSIEANYTTDPSCIGEADVVILAIPTPIDDNKKPDLTAVKKASETVGKHLKPGTIVVYESTVYPGVTEEICGQILENESGLKSGEDFFLGYSPERVNPGDKEHTIDKIIKIVAGQDEKTTDTLCELYGSVVTAGIHRAPNIKTAEMGKAIENAQRDLNIAFINEVAQMCHRIGIDTNSVLQAAGTKWNFLKFNPGLVGGHCIGVDPYYLVEKAKQLGMETHVISAGRKVNDAMPNLVAEETIKAMGNAGKVLAMGLTFKENIPDTRNSQSTAVISALKAAGCEVLAHDPHASNGDTTRGSLEDGPFDAVVVMVKHKAYQDMGTQVFIDATKENGVIYDVKGILDRTQIEDSGRTYLTL